MSSSLGLKNNSPGMDRAVIFDWGDTLMRVLPQFVGPMADWPRLELIPGVRRALEDLKGRYIVAAGSNAGPSDAVTMAQAFERAGILPFFDFLFTHVELEALKPDRRFFLRLVARMGLAPERCVMIGDDYRADVEGAKAAGLKAVLYAPGGLDPREAPLADAIITSLDQTPGAVDTLLNQPPLPPV